MTKSTASESSYDRDLPQRSPIERLLNPRSVAIAGVSATPGSLAAIVLDNLERFAFSGDIHLLHPKQARIRGRSCVKHASELPYGVDCVVLAIPAAAVLDAVKGCAERGVGGIVIFSAGFAELGAEGRAAQDEIAAIARSNNIAIEGPNCLGFVNDADGVALTFAVAEPRPMTGPGIAVISQSGAMAAVVRAALDSRALNVSVSISTGNEAANGIEDFIAYALKTGQTRAIAMVVEHIRRPREFLELARRARALGVVLVMLHPGRSGAARESARTHTGALTGDYEVMQAIVERAGVMIVETLEELIDISDCVMRCAHRPFGGVAILGESGAYKAIALDYCETLGVPLPQPTGEAATRLNAVAPGFIVASNPLDLTAQALVDPGLYMRALEDLMAHPDCGSLLVTIILSSSQMASRKMPPVLEALRHWSKRRAVLFAMLGDETQIPGEIITAVREAGVPFFRSPERAVRALARYARWADSNVRNSALSEEIEVSKRLPVGIIPEYAAKDILEQAGLPMPARRLVADVEAAASAARAIGYPVALKIQSAALPHKTEVGGVVLNLANEEELRSGWDRLYRNLGAAAELPIDGVLVERMSGAGLELILGARTDPEWGPVLVVGLGGILAEALKDVRVLPADATADEIKAALRALKGAALLGPFRGKPVRDIDALVSAVSMLGSFVRAHPEVSEIDVNPLIVFAEGEGVLALDALISCR
ncbi:acetate--CoA ligase family protein [Bradyrhizobium sp. JYMT SZCCT0180]|uniref:acetate--CoA ligase family protein n=1 Tax=Bradyrhizobium sp. JYMT SZCCT0180 TaxID=2807666 RepID=UPI001BA79527|nr:acetate--CoA ligase family protein [Bradyrhizobium sp. JYMT SZCCT0180]